MSEIEVLENAIYSEPDFVNMGFINPDVDNPVRIQDILPHLDLEFLRPVLNEMYAEDWRFGFDPIPMLKTMIYWRLSDKKFLTQIFNDLLTDPTLADNLGFKDIPDYKALYHWLHYRLGKKGVGELFTTILNEVIRLGKEQGLDIGKELVIDSTPLEKKNMKQASFNPKYNMMCVKYHNLRCVQTGIPLGYHITTGTEYDGTISVPMVYRAMVCHDIHPIRMFADNHYADAKDLMRFREFWGIEVIPNIAKNWVLSENADRKALVKAYQKFWKSDNFKLDADYEYMKFFLMMNDKTEVLENFYHNQVFQKYLKDPEGYIDRLKVRNAIEHSQGLEKKHTEIKNIQASNLNTMEVHIGMHVISRLTLALVRLQNGIKNDLVNIGGLI